MDVSRWAAECVRRTRQSGLEGVKFSTRQLYHKALQQISRLQTGTNVYDRHWDLLIVLDACRFDLFENTSTGQIAFSGVEQFESVDTMTQHWMRKTFTPQYATEMKRTGYICGNPFSAPELDADAFGSLDEVWRYAWDDDQGTLPARPVTDRAVATGRTEDYDRLIVHYMQPHCPFIPEPELAVKKEAGSFVDPEKRDVWMRLRSGELSKSRVWEGYRANLQYVLEELQLLRENIDADRAIVTSDHGNAVGEWGVYGHPVHMPHSCLRIVPWATIESNDHHTYEPTLQPGDTAGSVAERLELLGYS